MEEAIAYFLTSNDEEIIQLRATMYGCVPTETQDKRWHVKHICMMLLSERIFPLSGKDHASFIKCALGNLTYVDVQDCGEFLVSIDSGKVIHRLSYRNALLCLVSTLFSYQWHSQVENTIAVPERLLLCMLKEDGFRDYLFQDICKNCSDQIDTTKLLKERKISLSLYQQITQERYDSRDVPKSFWDSNPAKKRKIHGIELYYISPLSTQPANLDSSKKTSIKQQDIPTEQLNVCSPQTCGLALDLIQHVSSQKEALIGEFTKLITKSSHGQCKCGQLMSHDCILHDASLTMLLCKLNGINIQDFITPNTPLYSISQLISELYDQTYNIHPRLGLTDTPWSSYTEELHKDVMKYTSATPKMWYAVETSEIPIEFLYVHLEEHVLEFGQKERIHRLMTSKDCKNYFAYGFSKKTMSYFDVIVTFYLIRKHYARTWNILNNIVIVETSDKTYVVTKPEIMIAYRILGLALSYSYTEKPPCFSISMSNLLIRNAVLNYNIKRYRSQIRTMAYHGLVSALAYFLGSSKLVSYLSKPTCTTKFNLYYKLPYICSIWKTEISELIKEDGVKNSETQNNIKPIQSFLAMEAVHGITVQGLFVIKAILERTPESKSQSSIFKICKWGCNSLVRNMDVHSDPAQVLKLHKKSRKFDRPFDHVIIYSLITNPEIVSANEAYEILRSISLINRKIQPLDFSIGHLRGVKDLPLRNDQIYSVFSYWDSESFLEQCHKQLDNMTLSDCIGNDQGLTKETSRDIVNRHYESSRYANGFREPVEIGKDNHCLRLDEIDSVSKLLHMSEMSSFAFRHDRIDTAKVAPNRIRQALVHEDTCIIPVSSNPVMYFENSMYVPQLEVGGSLCNNTVSQIAKDIFVKYEDNLFNVKTDGSEEGDFYKAKLKSLVDKFN